jgi:DNA-binding MarR family transcriptional regulator
MRETLLPLLRERYPKIAKDLLGGLLEVLSAARAATDGDLDKFLVFLVIAMRTVEDRRFAELQFDEVLSGEVATYPSLHTNIRSIADSTGIPKETVRRKVASLIADGWVVRETNDLSITPLASQHITAAREPLLRLVAMGYQILNGLTDDPRAERA